MPSLLTPTIHSLFTFQVSMDDWAAPLLAGLGLVAGTFSLSLLVPICLSAVQPLWLRTWA